MSRRETCHQTNPWVASKWKFEIHWEHRFVCNFDRNDCIVWNEGTTCSKKSISRKKCVNCFVWNLKQRVYLFLMDCASVFHTRLSTKSISVTQKIVTLHSEWHLLLCVAFHSTYSTTNVHGSTFKGHVFSSKFLSAKIVWKASTRQLYYPARTHLLTNSQVFYPTYAQPVYTYKSKRNVSVDSRIRRRNAYYCKHIWTLAPVKRMKRRESGAIPDGYLLNIPSLRRGYIF